MVDALQLLLAALVPYNGCAVVTTTGKYLMIILLEKVQAESDGLVDAPLYQANASVLQRMQHPTPLIKLDDESSILSEIS